LLGVFTEITARHSTIFSSVVLKWVKDLSIPLFIVWWIILHTSESFKVLGILLDAAEMQKTGGDVKTTEHRLPCW
jgi:hypothetical protein